MTWVKLDDQFPDHPKVIAAGPQAGWLYICGICYSARYLTDGFVPASVVPRLMNANTTKLIERLVAVGLWEVTEDGYHIHDYLAYNPRREDVLIARQKTAKRQKEFRDKRSGKYVSNAGSNAVTNGVTNAPVTTAPIPNPIESLDTIVSNDYATASQQVELPKQKKGVSLTPTQRQLAALWNVKRPNATQLATIAELTDKHGHALVVEAAKWAHLEGMQFGHALNSIKKALPGWNRRNGNDRSNTTHDGLGRLPKRDLEYKVVTAAEVAAARREESDGAG